MSNDIEIKRYPSKATGRSAASIYGDFIWVATIPDSKPPSITEQALDIFAKLDRLLADLGSDKAHIISATVYLSDLAHKATFDKEWCEWIGPNRAHWPQRTCVGASLVGETLVEIMLVTLLTEPGLKNGD